MSPADLWCLSGALHSPITEPSLNNSVQVKPLRFVFKRWYHLGAYLKEKSLQTSVEPRNTHFWKRSGPILKWLGSRLQSNHLQALLTTTHCKKYISLPDHTCTHKKPETKFCWTIFIFPMYLIYCSFLFY